VDPGTVAGGHIPVAEPGLESFWSTLPVAHKDLARTSQGSHNDKQQRPRSSKLLAGRVRLANVCLRKVLAPGVSCCSFAVP